MRCPSAEYGKRSGAVRLISYEYSCMAWAAQRDVSSVEVGFLLWHADTPHESPAHDTLRRLYMLRSSENVEGSHDSCDTSEEPCICHRYQQHKGGHVARRCRTSDAAAKDSAVMVKVTHAALTNRAVVHQDGRLRRCTEELEPTPISCHALTPDATAHTVRAVPI